jgi:hypothetical protein
MTERIHPSAIAVLMAECEATRLRLSAALLRDLDHPALEKFVAARVAALEALAEHQRLVPKADGAFVPAADRHRPHTRKTKNDNAA